MATVATSHARRGYAGNTACVLTAAGTLLTAVVVVDRVGTRHHTHRLAGACTSICTRPLTVAARPASTAHAVSAAGVLAEIGAVRTAVISRTVLATDNTVALAAA